MMDAVEAVVQPSVLVNSVIGNSDGNEAHLSQTVGAMLLQPSVQKLKRNNRLLQKMVDAVEGIVEPSSLGNSSIGNLEGNYAPLSEGNDVPVSQT